MSFSKIIGGANFLVLKDGKKVSGNIDNLDFNNDDSYKIYEEITKDYNQVINIKKGKNVKIFEIIDILKTNFSLTINLEEDASLDYTSLRKGNEESNIKIIVNLGENATINTKHINIFSSIVNFNEIINASGEHASINSMDVVINSSGKSQRFDIESHHFSNLSSCFMRNFVINKNNSITHMNTNGYIEKNTKGVSISQKTKGLLLDLNSEISANPLLCIGEYDCNASHGASIGAINEEELYYLMSRGLTKENSEKLIVQGFINPFVLGLDNENLKNYILEETNKIL